MLELTARTAERLMRLHRFASRAHKVASDVAGRVLVHVLSQEAKQSASIAAYCATWAEKEANPGLFEWEERWFARRLPPAPARILVGAVGLGREAVVLSTRGYECWAFEPAPPLAARANAALPTRGVAIATYADLVQAASHATGPLRHVAQLQFDAVLLGWGSLAHVLGESHRRELLCACARLTPHGPVLASYFAAAGLPDASTHGRARRAGDRVGEFFGGHPRDCYRLQRYHPHYGFAEHLEQDELEAHALAMHTHTLVVECAGLPYPHSTYLPITPA